MVFRNMFSESPLLRLMVLNRAFSKLIPALAWTMDLSITGSSLAVVMARTGTPLKIISLKGATINIYSHPIALGP